MSFFERLKAAAAPEWRAYTEHPFTNGLADGSLAEAAFRHYYVLDAGMRGDLLALKVALAPCVIGYAEIATRLASRPDAHAATNPYRVWIAEYEQWARNSSNRITWSAKRWCMSVSRRNTK